MTFRAVLLGLLGAALICGVQYFNYSVLHQTMLVSNNMPVAVYGSLVLFVILINPLLYLIWKRLALTGPELAVILGLVLTVCCIPGSTLMRSFTTSLIMPYHYARTTPAWKSGTPEDVLQRVPPYMLADVRKDSVDADGNVTKGNEAEVLDTFVQGMSKGTSHITPDQVPWGAWRATLAFWIPLILIFWIGLLGLSVVVHRQWADHEHLPYPLATFAQALLPNAQEAVSGIFRMPLFWLGAIPVLLIHLNSYACKWFSATWIIPDVSMMLRWEALNKFGLGPTITQGGGTQIFTPVIFFTGIAIAYFIPAQVSLSLGLAAPIWALVAGTFAGYGMSVTTGDPSPATFMTFGAYTGLLVMLIFVGRRYYGNVLKRAFCLKTADTAPGESVWGARIFLLAMLVFVVYLCTLAGLDPVIAILYTGIAVMIFLVLGRVMAETGLIFLVPGFVPHSILVGIFGAVALGPQAFILAMMLGVAFFVDPRDTIVPFLMNSFKLFDLNHVKVGKAAGLAAAALLVGLSVAVPVTLYFQYDRGHDAGDEFGAKIFPKRPFDSLVTFEQKITAQDRVVEAKASTGMFGLAHFRNMSMDPKLVLGFAVGLGLILLCTLARLRWTKWPLHPVFFLMWTVYAMKWLFAAFLLGWLAKTLVTRFGGARTYHQLKPLMFGLIAGEMMAGVLTIIIGGIYYMVTGQTPKSFSITPF